MKLAEALGISDRPELVSLVGGGGKSSLLFALGAELAAAGRGVVLTTTTRIATAETERLPTRYYTHQLAAGRPARLTTPCLVIGDVGREKAKSVPLNLPGRLLARPEVDVVLVEADGAKMLPIKAPDVHEPAVPPDTTLLVVLAGIDALAHPLGVIAHRPRRVSALTGRAATEQLRPADVATLLTHRQGGLKAVPDGARVIVFLNKVETPAEMEAAAEIARQIIPHPRIEKVILGALKRERPVRALFSLEQVIIPDRPAGESGESR